MASAGRSVSATRIMVDMGGCRTVTTQGTTGARTIEFTTTTVATAVITITTPLAQFGMAIISMSCPATTITTVEAIGVIRERRAE